jgi:hypothetical protein
MPCPDKGVSPRNQGSSEGELGEGGWGWYRPTGSDTEVVMPLTLVEAFARIPDPATVAADITRSSRS